MKPVTLVVSPTRKLRVEPTELGAAAQVLKAVKTAVRVRTPGFAVPLSVEVNHLKLDRYLADLAKTTDQRAGRREPRAAATSAPSPRSRSRGSG